MNRTKLPIRERIGNVPQFPIGVDVAVAEKIAPEVAHASEEANTPEVVLSPEEIPVPEDTGLNNHEISIKYVHDMKLWDRSKTIIDDVFVYSAALDVDINYDPEPQSVDECRRRTDWPKWKDAIQKELNSLRKREVFGFVVQTPIGTTTEVNDAIIYLKTEFEMKDLGRTKYYLGIQIEHLSTGIFLHQSTYTEKVLNRFYMDKSHPLTTPMEVRSLEPDKDPFRPREDDEDVLGPEIPNLDIIRSPTVMFEDNTACIDQLKEGYIKEDRMKYISPKFSYTHELQKNGEIDVQQIRSCDNLVDLFTKSLPNSTFEKLRYNIGMR
ncbi:hypothetical protein AgCh_002054 [Apium graveolens]